MSEQHTCPQRVTHSPIAPQINALLCGCMSKEEYQLATDPILQRDRQIARLKQRVAELEAAEAILRDQGRG